MEAYSEIERLWIKEAARRLDAYRRGDIEAVSGDEVMRRARKRFSQEFGKQLRSGEMFIDRPTKSDRKLR
jgi:hypothetical protein